MEPSPPFLEEAHALASAVGAPEVTTAGGGVAAVAGPVVAVPAAPNAGSPENVDQRRTFPNILQQLQVCRVLAVVGNTDLHVLVSRIYV